MLKGTTAPLYDRQTKKMIWKDGDERYYAREVTDPDDCVLKFTARNGRYYSNFKSENFEIE
jgi:general stress protein 26